MIISFLEAAAPAEQIPPMNEWLQRLIDLGTSVGKHILLAVLVFVVGRLLVGVVNRIVARMLNRQRIEPSVQTFLRSFINILLTILLIISVIGALGVNTASFAALLASAGVAIGMALSGNLQNFAGGLVILLFKPYKVGDWIEAQGVQGKVAEIQIFHTLLTMSDNKVVYVPNGAMSTAVVINYTRNDTRRLEWTIGIDYGVSVEKAREAVMKVINAEKRVLADPAPVAFVGALADSSVNIVVRAWVKIDDYWDVYNETLRNIYNTFNECGIGFPYPQQTVHIVKD